MDHRQQRYHSASGGEGITAQLGAALAALRLSDVAWFREHQDVYDIGTDQFVELDLAACCGGDYEATALAESIEKSQLRLSLIDVSYNRIGPRGAWRLLATVVTTLPCLLMSLRLEANLIGDAGAVALARLLPYAPLLVLLNLSENGITEHGVAALALAWPRCARLGILHLGSSGLDDRTLFRVAWQLQERPRDTLSLTCDDAHHPPDAACRLALAM